MTMAPPLPSITAISTDGSLLAVHTPSTTLISTSTKKRLVIRCYDASLSYGAVRFTLSTNIETTTGENDASSSLVKQLLFISSSTSSKEAKAPPSHLCAMTSQNQILVWDLNRGVLIHTIVPFLPKDGKRMTLHSIASSSFSSGGEEEGGASLYALITRKDKVIMYEYSIEHGKLVRKIKSGSLEDDDDDDEDTMGKKATYLGVAVGTSSLTHNTIYAVRHADHIRLMDHVGNKLKKLSLSLNDDDDDEEEGDKRGGANSDNTPVIVQFSHDGKLLIASYSSSSLVLFNVEKEKQCGIIQLSDTHSDISTFIQNVDILLDTTTTTKMKSETDNDDDDDDEAYTVVLTSSNGIAQLYQTTLSTLKKKKKKKKKKQICATTICTFKSSSEWMNIGRIHFHSVKSDTKLVVTLVPHGSVASATTSSKGGVSTSTIAVREHSYRTTTDDDYKIIKGDVIIHVLSEEEKEKDAKKKRKLQDTTTTTSSSSAVVVLGPGDAGGEALGASDIMAVQQQKKIKMTDTKKEDDDDDDDEFRLPYDDDDDDDDEGEGKESIGERLKQLSSALDDPTDSEDDDDDDDDDEPKSSALTTKSRSSRAPATSESIATLLTQALLSNDDAQLEVALHVPDVRIINASLKALKGHPYKEEENKNKHHSQQQQSRAEFEYHQKGEILAALLAKLVTRLARAPSRAQNLGGWLRGTLVALKEHNEQSSGSGSGMKKGGGGGGGGNEIDLASKLAPLKNLLNDRVESFPHLLRLEGRLSLLGNRG